MPLGEYEQIVEEALEVLSDGPWKATDLVRARDIINDEFCGGYGADCTSSAVLDWLRSLSQKDADDLVFRLNADWSEKQISDEE
jgi:hypothetical protein